MVIEATAEQRARISEWAGVVAVNRFMASVALRRHSSARFSYHAKLIVDVTQSCVVTLEPVHSQLNLDVARALHLIKSSSKSAEHPSSPASDDAPEEIEDGRYDLAAPLLEEFALALDPYPRCPGVEFEPPPDGDTQASPFAVLKALRESN
ncbi:MAG: DUF177 domain-containing protein [Alphaproteobacteria bacterium]|nr:DUF177 domain-containing protein [Alphaproteobacteria bacterium]